MHIPTPLNLLSLSLILPLVQSTTTCTRPTRNGDTINVHYTGTLASDGTQFDSSYDRGQPLQFTLGRGMVIRGFVFVLSFSFRDTLVRRRLNGKGSRKLRENRWEEGLLEMCEGERRRLVVPPEKGYGDRDVGSIKAGSTLVFETELVGILGVEKEL